MSAPVQVQSFRELVDVFAAAGRDVEHSDAEEALAAATHVPELHGGRIIVRWDAQDPFVHIVQPMIADVPAERADAVARFVCRFNNPTKLVGLGYDEGGRLIFYRTSLVRMKDGVRSDYVLNVSRAVAQSAREALPAVRALVDGASVEEAAKLAGV